MDELYTVKEVSGILKVNVHTVYDLIKAGLLPALKLGSLKVRRISLMNFLEKYDGMDLSDLTDIKNLELAQYQAQGEQLRAYFFCACHSWEQGL